MRIAIDARVRDGEFGGIQQTMLGLAAGLADLDDGEGDEYHFLVWEDHDWLQPALTGPCRALVVREPRRGRIEQSALAQRKPAVARTLGHLLESRGRILPAVDPILDAVGIDLVHFMQQRGFRTSLPSIYQPHDLQHLHFPEHFHPLQRFYRQRSYRAMARQADRVGVMTTAAQAEVSYHLRVAPERIIVVPWASVFALTPAKAQAPLPAGCPPRYLLYPAHSWPHKNHECLVHALSELRTAHGLDVALVCTGRQTAHFDRVRRTAAALGVEDLLHPVDYVSRETLRSLYVNAVGLVFPTLYEGWGLPVVEAFALGTPVCCSDISPLREITAEAALRFDPRSPADMAKAIARLWTDAGERDELVAAGRERAELFTWTRTAALFRAHYRDVLGLALSDDDRSLLAEVQVV